MNLNKENLNKVYRTLASFIKASVSDINGDRILMKAENGKLTFMYNNSNIVCRCHIPCDSDETFSYRLRLRCIGAAVKFRGDADMSITDNVIKFSDGISAIKEKVSDAGANDSLPSLPHNEDNSITVNAQEFWKMMRTVKNIQHTSQGYKEMHQLWLKYSDNKLTAASETMGLIARKTITAAGKSDVIWSNVLNRKYIDLIQNVKDNECIRLYLHSTCFEIEADNIYMRILFQLGCIAKQKIDLNKTADSCFSLSDDALNKLELLATLEAEELLCQSGSDQKIYFKVQNGKNHMSCSSPLFEYSGESFDFKVNFKKFHNLLKSLPDCSELTFKYSHNSGCIVFFSKDKSFYGAIA